MSLIELRKRALEVAVGEIGVRETGINRGPRVASYQKAAGIFPGDPWCMAFVVFCYDEAARSLNMESPIPRTGRVSRFFRRCPPLWRGGRASVGAIYGHLRDPKRPETSRGHCGIVYRLHEGFSGIEGNTNDFGSKGEGVASRYRTASYVNLGYVDIGREGPEEVLSSEDDETRIV